MADNSTPHMSGDYDRSVEATIPFYREFHRVAVDLVRSLDKAAPAWLDTGCGTGTLCLAAQAAFPGAAFTLADPSAPMLEVAKSKLQGFSNIAYIHADSQGLTCADGTFDVVTAIQCHHYLDKPGRRLATANCFRMLKPGGVFITFENILPLSKPGVEIGLKRWGAYQIRHGRSPQDVAAHRDRFGKEYFPITIPEHIDTLKETGFAATEILWASYMQAGFYAIKA